MLKREFPSCAFASLGNFLKFICALFLQAGPYCMSRQILAIAKLPGFSKLLRE